MTLRHASYLESMTLRRQPSLVFGPGASSQLSQHLEALLGRSPALNVTFFVDSHLHGQGAHRPLGAALEAAGASVSTWVTSPGEPKEKTVRKAIAFTRATRADLVVCLGGGSTMDTGKIAATLAYGSEDAFAAYIASTRPLPRQRVPSVCIPTTAGTGSEFSSTNIFTLDSGEKGWLWAEESKPQLVFLDATLSCSLPPELTAWTGFDALVHALEACTNVRHHLLSDMYAHKALHYIASALFRAVHHGADLEARGKMLLGSAYAGIAIDNCSAGFAHNISHALSALAPIHHGFATALGMEVILGWQVAHELETGRPSEAFIKAAEACGLGPNASALPAWFSDLMAKCGLEAKLPPAFAAFRPEDLAAQMMSPQNAYMRASSVRPVTDEAIRDFAARVMALA